MSSICRTFYYCDQCSPSPLTLVTQTNRGILTLGEPPWRLWQNDAQRNDIYSEQSILHHRVTALRNRDAHRMCICPSMSPRTDHTGIVLLPTNDVLDPVFIHWTPYGRGIVRTRGGGRPIMSCDRLMYRVHYSVQVLVLRGTKPVRRARQPTSATNQHARFSSGRLRQGKQVTK